ncbi:MAG: DUF3365 domain-containing protein, partial [Nitrospirae bacterium]|nr:DUF3365 domain-containing protein [Nitrospirota bacterium]
MEKNRDTGKARTLMLKLFSPNAFALTLLAVLTVSLSASLAWNIIQQEKSAFESARIYARTALEKDILYRRWNTLLGGVYAEVSDNTPPNPYLDKIVNERDIKTFSGKELTLINPAYMTRQVHELGKKENGVLGHITSLKPIRLENAPDAWEKRALLAFEKGEAEVSSIETLNGKEYMRLMHPLITEEGCLQCHESQGYKKGDIRGGISVSVPMEPLRTVYGRNFKALLFGHIFLWLCGVAAIYAGYRLRNEVEKSRREAEEKLLNAAEEWRLTFDSITDLVSVHDSDYRIVKCNKAFADFFNKKPEELIGMHCYEVVHGLDSPFSGCPHKEMLESGRAETKEIFNSKLGLHLMTTASPVFKDGELKGSVHYIKDISESKKLENLLNTIAEKISVKT